MKKMIMVSAAIVCFWLLLFRVPVFSQGENGVTFADNALEQQVRKKIDKPDGVITHADLAGIKSLFVSKDVRDLEGIEFMTNLDLLYLNSCPQEMSLAPVGELKKLTTLSITKCPYLDYSPLIHLTSVQELMLQQDQISDISFIANMNHLMTLVLMHNDIKDITVLTKTPYLSYLLLTDNHIQDLSPLKHLRGLKQIEVGYNQISDLSPLADFSGFVLDVNDNRIKDLTLVHHYSSIYELKVRNNPLTEASKQWVENVKTNPKIKIDADEIHVFIDGVEQPFEVSPLMINGSTLVPMRAIFEKLGASVTWDPDTRSVKATKGNKTIQITIQKLGASANGQDLTLPTPPVIINETTMVPVRAVSETLGSDVKWKEETRTVAITTSSAQ